MLSIAADAEALLMISRLQRRLLLLSALADEFQSCQISKVLALLGFTFGFMETWVDMSTNVHYVRSLDNKIIFLLWLWHM